MSDVQQSSLFVFMHDDLMGISLPLRISQEPVYRITSQFHSSEEDKEGSATTARKIHSRDRSARFEDMILALHVMINYDSGVPIRILVISLQVGEATIRRTVHEDLWYKSYLLKIRQALDDLKTQDSPRRSDRCRRRLDRVTDFSFLLFVVVC